VGHLPNSAKNFEAAALGQVEVQQNQVGTDGLGSSEKLVPIREGGFTIGEDLKVGKDVVFPQRLLDKPDVREAIFNQDNAEPRGIRMSVRHFLEPFMALPRFLFLLPEP